jgi:hypothetical protein
LTRLLAALVFLEAGHDLDEVAGAVAIVELPFQDLVPGVAAGAGNLASRLIDLQSQNMTVAARATADRKVFAHRS